MQNVKSVLYLLSFIVCSLRFVPTTQNLGPLTCYESYYRKLYTSMSNSYTAQHWTHLPRCEFIQLAMIGSGGLRRGDREEEMVRLAQQGRIETILDRKSSIDLDNLFQAQQPPHPRVILIEGAPGGGKSTLALHICHKWAQGASFLAQFDLVLLAYLRDQAIHNATTLADILPACNFRLSEMIASQIQDFNGENVLFIFDGWDEFPSYLHNNSLVLSTQQFLTCINNHSTATQTLSSSKYCSYHLPTSVLRKPAPHS